MSRTQINMHDITRIEIGEPKLGLLPGPVYYHRDVVFHSIDGSKTTITAFTQDGAKALPIINGDSLVTGSITAAEEPADV